VLNNAHAQADCSWKFKSPSRRVGPVPNCPDVELEASSWPRRIGGAESAAPSCPIDRYLQCFSSLTACKYLVRLDQQFLFFFGRCRDIFRAKMTQILSHPIKIGPYVYAYHMTSLPYVSSHGSP